jgi:hypothetical protein
MSAEFQATGRRFVPHAQAAKIRGVSGRTLDRWIASGILPQPEIINRRKYHDLAVIENVRARKAES